MEHTAVTYTVYSPSKLKNAENSMLYYFINKAQNFGSNIFRSGKTGTKFCTVLKHGRKSAKMTLI